jgi:hypothetical protein
MRYRTLIQSDPYLLNQIAYYPFNSNSNDLINAQNGTDTNISYSNVGQVGNSATFNGTSSLISVADNDNFSFGSNSFSINIWIYPVGNSGFLLSKRNASFIEYQLSYNISGSTITLALYGGGITSILIGKTFNFSLTASTWQMLTFTFSGGTLPANINGYHNSTLISSFTTQTVGSYVGMSNTSAGVVFGRQGNAAAGFFNGRLDQTRFWNNRQLTQLEITEIYNNNY